MRANKRTSARIKLANYLLSLWKTEEQQQYPGVRFGGDDAQWHGGYGEEHNDGKPDFVKKDNDGWDYVTRSEE